MSVEPWHIAIALGVLNLIGIAVIWFNQITSSDELAEAFERLGKEVAHLLNRNEFTSQRVLTRVNKIEVPERTDMAEDDFMPDGDKHPR